MRKVVRLVVLSFLLLVLSLHFPYSTAEAEENTVVSTYSVSLPAEITLANDDDSYTGSYTVGVKGSIKPYEVVEVIPSSSVNIIGKTTGTVATATISQEVTNWSNVAVTDGAVIGTDDYVPVNGCVTVDLTQADEYEGEFEFSFKLGDRPGIYNSDGELVSELSVSLFSQSFSSTNTVKDTLGLSDSQVYRVVLPRGVTSIPDYAFYNCKSLKKIVLPDGLQTIKGNSFRGCSALEEINFPSSLWGVYAQAFEDCTSLRIANLHDNITMLQNVAFKGCTSLEEVYLSSKIKTTGASVFEGCTSLRTVTGCENLESITSRTFYGCTTLESVPTFKNCKTVYQEAFYNCTNLKSVKFTNYLTFIGQYVFRNSGLESMIMPDTVTFTGMGVFMKCKNLTDLHLSTKLKYISAHICQDCDALVSVSIPDGVTSINANAFNGCDALVSISIPDGVTNIENSAFSGCSALKSISIPDSVTSIGANAFYYCSALKSISIPEGVTSIGASAFYNSGLTSASLPDSITSLGTDAFKGCKSLEYLKLPISLTSIPSRVCYSCTNLISVELPNQFTTIGNEAFRCCAKLQSFDFKEGLISIGDRAFDSCTTLQTPTFPSTLESFGEGAFAHCKAFTSLDIPEKVTVISDTCFADMAITSVVFRGSITSISNRAFYQCGKLKSFPWQDSMKSVGSRAFYQAHSLITTVPNTVESIASDAFKEAYSVHYYGALEGAPWGASTVHIHKYGYCTVCDERCPGIYNLNGNLVYSFSEEDFTRIYDDSLERPITEITSIGSENIKYVAIPEDVTSIPDSMFKGCLQLKEVDFPASVISIGTQAFYGCQYANIVIPDTVTSIGENAFYKAQSITYSGTAEGAPWGALSVNSVSTTSLEVQEVRKDWNSIVEDYPDKWVVLKDVTFDGEDIESAVVVSVETDDTIIEYQENHSDDNFVYRRTTESVDSGII